MTGDPAQRKLILYMSMSLDGLPLLHGLPKPLALELVGSTAWADGPITQAYVPR